MAGRGWLQVFLGYIIYDLIHVLAIRELRSWEAIVHHVLFSVVAYLVSSFVLVCLLFVESRHVAQ